jgi:glycosyltransferase involved in cell wall biosynthesis
MSPKDNFWVHVQQPTVPHYRLAFFDAVADRLGRKLRVSASPDVRGGPASVADQRDYLDLDHPCRDLIGGRAMWQCAMQPAPDVGRGDVAVLCGNPRILSTVRFAWLARQRGMGLVWWGHGWSPTSSDWSMCVRAALMRQMNTVLLYTDDEAIEWRPRLPPTVGVFGAQNAIDQSQISKHIAHWTEERLARFRRESGIEDRQLLLFCGRLRTRPSTGVDILLRALPRLIGTDSRYLAVIIGDGEDRLRLQEMADRLGVSAHVRWVGEQYEDSRNAPWFLSALCFVYPGPIGLSLLHAMGYGLPVVTHGDRRRHNPEITALRHGWNGLEFIDGDVDDLAQQVASIGADPDRHRAMSSNARSTAMCEFSVDSMAERFCAAVMHARRSVLAGAAN